MLPRLGTNQLTPQLGIYDDSIHTAVAWTVDPTSGKAVPANATEWTAFLAAFGLPFGVPDHLYLYQEASGSIVDQIGGLNLSVGGSTYQQSLTGWTRKQFKTADNTADNASSSAYPNANANSYLMVSIGEIVSPASSLAHYVSFAGSTSTMGLKVNTTPRLTVAGSPGTLVTGTVDPRGVRILGLQLDRAGALRNGYTDQEKLIGTSGTAQSGASFFGAGGFTAASANAAAGAGVAYQAVWTGTHAEGFTAANIKALYTAMGWTIPWS